jgi:hypothetical protein
VPESNALAYCSESGTSAEKVLNRFAQILFFIISTLVMLLPSTKWETFYYIFGFSVNKSLLPIATTIVNFSLVRSLQKSFWCQFDKKIIHR